jgi:carboxypeptidase Taq
MNTKELIKKYREYYKVNEMISNTLSIIGFEDETDAPKKAHKEREEILNYFYMEYFKRTTSNEYLGLLEEMKKHYDSLPPLYQRAVTLDLKDVERDRKVPEQVAEESQKVMNQSSYYWKEAKQNDDYSIWAPYFKEVIHYSKVLAKYYGAVDNSYYNTYLDMYEEGTSEKELDIFFDKLKKRIVPLLKKVMNSKVNIRTDFLHTRVNKTQQEKLGKLTAKSIGYDFSRGMLKETEHPFTNGLTHNDVRITTHYYENDWTSNVYSCAHEGGHGIYEQNLNKKYEGTSVYGACSMAFHESQSRFFENIIAKNKNFVNYIFPKYKKIIPSTLKDVSVEEFYKAINKVQPSLIRTEADELTYCLHIIVRYEIEKLIFNNDDIDVNDLPRIWNEKYKEYLGITPPSDKEGILQDVHWSTGFGYFFSYAVGNAYSAQIYHKMKEELDVDKLLSEGKVNVIKDWLTKNIYSEARMLSPKELIKKVTGEDLNPDYYCDYLENKYSEIYELDKDE